MTREPMSLEHMRLMADMWRAGRSIEDIAQHLGRPVDEIRWRLEPKRHVPERKGSRGRATWRR